MLRPARTLASRNDAAVGLRLLSPTRSSRPPKPHFPCCLRCIQRARGGRDATWLDVGATIKGDGHEQEKGVTMNLDAFAKESGFAVQEVEVALEAGRTRPGWLVYDLAAGTFVRAAVNWTTAAEVEAYIQDSTGSCLD